MPHPVGLARRLPRLLRQLHDRRRQILQQQILRERVFRRNRLHRLIRLHRSLIDAARTIEQAPAERSEARLQFLQRQRTQIAHRRDAQLGQLGRHHLAHARHAVHRQRRQELLDAMRWHHELPIRLAPIRGDLGQELVRRDPRGRRQLRLLADLRADDLCNLRRHRHAALVLGHIEIRFIQRQRLHQLRMPQENLAHLAGHRLVTDEIRGHEHRIRTQPLRAYRGHRRAHAEHARFVGGRAHHRAHAAPRHHHRFAPQRGIVALLHGRVKRIHVDVNDLAGAGHGPGHSDSDEQDYSHTPQYGCWITTTCVFEPENTTAAYG